LQGVAVVFDVNGLIGEDLAAVPHVAVAESEVVGAGGDQDLVSQLFGGAMARAHDPIQARLLFAGDRIFGVHAPGIDAIFAAEVAGLDQIMVIIRGIEPVGFANGVGGAVAPGVFEIIGGAGGIRIDGVAAAVHGNV